MDDCEDKKRSILLVEDDEGDALLIEEMLQDVGFEYEVTVAKRLKEALDLLGKQRVDIVLLDLSLPDSTGLETVSRMLRHTPRTPVAALTGLDDADTAAQSVRLGAQDYLVKDELTPGQLERAIRYAMERKRTEVELNAYRLRLEAIFYSLPDAIATVGADGRILEANPSFARLTGIRCAALVGRSLEDLEGPRNPALRNLTQKAAASKKTEIARRIGVNLCGSGIEAQVTAVPFVDPSVDEQRVILVLRDMTRLAELEREVVERRAMHRLVGRSEPMLEVYRLMEQLAGHDTTVLVAGESGTGKELVAESLHRMGPRAKGPLVKVNCHALSESLLESELFGHAKGAFTGAVQERAGRVQTAEGGTLFLDEIGDISQSLQAKLLRFLETKEFERVGEDRTRKADVRVIAATNADLPALVAQGRFRQDLYYRLKVVVVQLPPLRLRRTDIPLLTEHFVEQFRKKLGKPLGAPTRETLRALMEYSWPGNVRELKHALEHACILCTGDDIDVGHLPPELRGTRRPAPTSDSKAPVSPRAVGPEEIVAALENARWNKTLAAKALGIGRRTLYDKIKRFGIR